jgi:hypothetical protein
MLNIKNATILDAATISFLGSKTFTETFGYLFSELELNKYLDDTFNANKVKESLNKPASIWGLAYYFNKPVGYFKVKLDSSFEDSEKKQIQLQKIYVLKDYLNKKVGGALLQYIFQLIQLHDHQVIWLNVLHTNDRAIYFYEKHGFKKFRKSFYKIGGNDLEYELMIKEI